VERNSPACHVISESGEMNNGFHKGDQVTIGHSGRVGRVLAVTDAALYVKWNDNPHVGWEPFASYPQGLRSLTAEEASLAADDVADRVKARPR
jgi:hypothetical protein